MKNFRYNLITAFVICINHLCVQNNLAKDYNFEDRMFVLNPSEEVEPGVWYAYLRNATVGNFEIVKDELADSYVFHAATKVVSDRNDAFLAQKIGHLERKNYKLGFWVKMMHRNAVMRVEAKIPAWEGANIDINYANGALPGNWNYYELPIDLTTTALNENSYLTVSFYFNNVTDETTLTSPGVANEAWKFYISNLSLSENFSAVTDSGFEQWTNTFPVTPVQWTTSGDACFKRCYGHKFSDFGIKATVFDSETSPQIQTKNAAIFPADKFKVFFWAKAGADNTQLQIEIANIVQTVTLGKKYKRFAVQFANAEKSTSGTITFRLPNNGIYHIDQVSVEEDSGSDDQPVNITNIVSGDPISVQYYSLQGILMRAKSASSLQSGIYIVKKVYESGKNEVNKIIVK
jgi:hypothetical protein